MGLSQALTKGDANAIEKATDPGDITKACGSESNSDTDVDEDSEWNESASENEVLDPVDKKASRKENKKVKELKREASKNKVLKAVKKEGRSWPKPIRLGSRLWLWY